MVLKPHCIFRRGSGPLVAAAIHHGHEIRASLRDKLAIDEATQLREEDPFTGELTQFADTQIVGLRSRFEVDLNRPREKSIYLSPADAWGLQVWKEPLAQDAVDTSLRLYDLFYADVCQVLNELLQQHSRLVVYDLHSYNHRRAGPSLPAADPVLNPEVNIGTGTMDRSWWAPVVDRLVLELERFDFQGRSLDVRENVKFCGGHFGRWIHSRFEHRVCAIAIEFKKFFMDEWQRPIFSPELRLLYEALDSTTSGVQAALEGM